MNDKEVATFWKTKATTGKELENLVTKQLLYNKLEVEEKKCKGQWMPTGVWKAQGYDTEAMEREDPNSWVDPLQP